MTEHERREEQRVIFEARVELMTASGPMPVYCDARNISTQGIYVQGREMLPIGTRCSLEVELSSDASVMHVHLQGKVCRHDSHGMGITFLNLDEASFVHLKSYVMLQQQNPIR